MAELQLRRTTGTVYGELMRDSGISLPNGRYISGRVLVSELMGNGIGTRAVRQQIIRDIINSPGYGERDNIWTGVQSINKVAVSYTDYFVTNTQYTFNPWKELMGGNSLNVPSSLDINGVFESLRHNPREGVEKIKELYALFARLPKTLQDRFLDFVDSRPCDLGMMAYQSLRDMPFEQLSMIHEILQHTHEKHREEIMDLLELIVQHNICVGKGAIVRREIDHLMGFDVSRVPTRWRKGTLDEAVLTEERIRELKGLLQREKIRTS